MGAAATGPVPHNRARKEGKRYRWGAERPSVLERRVQFRKKQIDAEIAEIEERYDREKALRIAAKEAERLKLADQEALLAEHREDVRQKKAFRSVGVHFVFTAEQREAIKAQYPGIDDEEADFLLRKRARQSMAQSVSALRDPRVGGKFPSLLHRVSVRQL